MEHKRTALINSINNLTQITNTIQTILNSQPQGTIYLKYPRNKINNETAQKLTSHIQKTIKPAPIIKHSIEQINKKPIIKIDFYKSPDSLNSYASYWDTNIDFSQYKAKLKITQYKDYSTELNTINYSDTINNLINIALRYKHKDIPLEAYKETITNAFVHNDYTINNEIIINIYPRRTDIINSGSFPLNMTPFDFMDYEYKAFIRNPKLHELHKTSKGFKTIAKLCLENKIAYSFQIEENKFSFIFYYKESSFYLEEKTFLKLSKIEYLLYASLRDNPFQNKTKLAHKFYSCDKTIQRHLSAMKKYGLIKRVGSNKTGHWEIT